MNFLPGSPPGVKRVCESRSYILPMYRRLNETVGGLLVWCMPACARKWVSVSGVGVGLPRLLSYHLRKTCSSKGTTPFLNVFAPRRKLAYLGEAGTGPERRVLVALRYIPLRLINRLFGI